MIWNLLGRGSKQRESHNFDHMFDRIEYMSMHGFNPSVIFDIGASNGKWTKGCSKIFPLANFFCVDPLEENEHFLSNLSSENRNVSFWMGCLGAEPGKVVVNVDGDGSSILKGHYGNPYGTPKEVRMETLDNLIKEGICQTPDLIKLDVQGYELMVLKGAQQAIQQSEAIIVEVSFFPFQEDMPIFHEVVSTLSEYGYVVYDILSLGMRPLDNAPGQCDLLFLKKMHPLLDDHKWDVDSIY